MLSDRRPTWWNGKHGGLKIHSYVWVIGSSPVVGITKNYWHEHKIL
jgi:hypothetical protein